MDLLMIWHAGTVPQYRDRFHALQELFDDVVVAVPEGWREVRKYPFPHGQSGDTTFVRLPCLFPHHPYTIIYRGLGQLIREQEPDVLYVHEEPLAPSTLQAAFHARRTGIPYVVDSALNHMSWTMWRGNPIEQYVYRTVDLVYYRNEQCRKVLHKRGCPKDKLRGPMPNGVSERTFSPVPSDEAEAFLGDVSDGRVPPHDGSASTPMLLGFAGHIRYEKGIDLLLRVPSMTEGVEVVLCGPMIDETYAQPLQDTPKVHYLGELTGDDMPKFYSACDLLALPSIRSERLEESFGRVLTESIFCGTPAIGSDIGMIDEIVGKQATFAEEDIDALASLVRSLQDTSKRASLLDGQVQRAQERYTWSVIAETVWNDAQILVEERDEV